MAQFRITFYDGNIIEVDANSNRMAKATACVRTGNIPADIVEWRIISGQRKKNRSPSPSTAYRPSRDDTWDEDRYSYGMDDQCLY